MKLAGIRPQHLNLLYEQLAQSGIRGGFTEKAYAKVDFKALLKEKGLTMHGLEVKLPGNKHHSILNLCSSCAVKAETAKMIADVLEMSAMTLTISSRRRSRGYGRRWRESRSNGR